MSLFSRAAAGQPGALVKRLSEQPMRGALDTNILVYAERVSHAVQWRGVTIRNPFKSPTPAT
jgi:hypothetical protein